jgi:hypothetical protein
MIPNRQSPAYALFTRRPILPQPAQSALLHLKSNLGRLAPPLDYNQQPQTHLPRVPPPFFHFFFCSRSWTQKLRHTTVVAKPRDSSSPFCPLGKDGVLKESTTKDGRLIAHLNILGGREKQNFEHLRGTKDLTVAWSPRKACASKLGRNISIAQGGALQILSAFVKQRTYRRDHQERMNWTRVHETL